LLDFCSVIEALANLNCMFGGMRCLNKLFREFHQIYILGTVGDGDALIRFSG